MAGIPGRPPKIVTRTGLASVPATPERAWDNEGVVQRPPTGSIPDAPGSYQFKDAEGRIIYVGKAKSLRSRLSNYFAPPETLPVRTRQMVTAAASVEWIEVRNEVEALFLEFNLIKRHRPRFNIRLKDDKSFPYLAVTLDEEWPRAMVMRGKKRKGVRYFGPYAHAYAIRETLDLLLRTFPIRTCTNAKFDRHHKLGRPCLYAHIEKCVAPCVGDVDQGGVRRARPGADLVPRRRHRPGRRPARAADARGVGRARVRAGGPPARPAPLGAQGHRAPADGREPLGGPRRHRHRRRPARGGGPGVLRAQGPRRRPQGA